MQNKQQLEACVNIGLFCFNRVVPLVNLKDGIYGTDFVKERGTIRKYYRGI